MFSSIPVQSILKIGHLWFATKTYKETLTHTFQFSNNLLLRFTYNLFP